MQQFSIDLQQAEVRNRARFQEYFVQDDWRLIERRTVNAGVRYTLNFPSTEETDQAAVFNLETQALEYLGLEGQPRSARELHRLNFGPRLGIAGRIGDWTAARVGYALVWIELTGITTPFTTPVFPLLQTVSQRSLDNITPAFILANGPSVEPIPLTAQAGRVRRGTRSRFRLRAAVECVRATHDRCEICRWSSHTSARRSPGSDCRTAI